MNWQVILAWGMLFVSLMVAAWDILAVANQQPQRQVSAILKEWSTSHPILPFAIGVLTGHVFW